MKDFNEELLNHPLVEDGREELPRHESKTWRKREPTELKGAVLHQSLFKNGSAKATARYHAGPNHISQSGLPGLSYTMFVEREDTVWLANDVEDRTLSQGDASQVGDENEMYLAICFGGDFPGPGHEGKQEPSAFQLDAATSLWTYLKGLFGWTNDQLFGHYDFGKAACPGSTLQTLIEAINKDVDWTVPKYNLSTFFGRQEALKELGYYEGKIDGDWGPKSRASLVQFQKSVGLVADGLWGKKTSIAVLIALE